MGHLARFDALGKLLADEVHKLDGVAQAGDCKQLAAALRGFAAQHRPQMDELNDLAHALTPDERALRSDEIEDYGHRWDSLTGHAKACSADGDVKAALELAGF